MIQEIWKDIPGYEGRYQASSAGNIRSVTRTITQIGRCGLPFKRTLQGKVLRPAATKQDPHLSVVLGHGAFGSPVHQLVARTFLGPCPLNEEVRHINGNAQDNRIENLCYGTRTDNILDVYRQGHRWRKLSLDEIEAIYVRSNAGETGHPLAVQYGVSDTTVSKIKRGEYKSCFIT